MMSDKLKGGFADEPCVAKLNAVSDAMYVLGGKWKFQIIVALLDENRRFNELQRLIDGISAKVLSHELKELEINDLVLREVYEEHFPMKVEYELTDYALTLTEVIDTLSAWGKQHKEKIKESMRNDM